jgi:hypothetical protein
VSRLCSAPHHLIGADHLRQPRRGSGAGIEMILQRLSQHVAAGAGDELLDGVFRAYRHLWVTQAGDQSIEQGAGSGVSVGYGHGAEIGGSAKLIGHGFGWHRMI